MPTFIIDSETDGLLDTITKIHVIGWHNYHTGKSGTITSYPQMKKFLTQKDLTLICHNAIRFDKPAFEKILGIKLDCRIIDSLFLSWYLEPERPKHGLEFYGIEFGVLKPKVADWSAQPLAVYINRVIEDVKINVLLFQKQIKYLKLLYENDINTIDRLINYLMFKADCALEQEQVRWKLDVDKCQEILLKFEEEFERKTQLLAEHMPETIKYRNINKPKIYHKKDGSLSKKAEDWEALLEELGYDINHSETIQLEKDREEGNPGSHQQLKDWLFNLGWKPVTFKFDKDEVTGKIRKIPQISLPQGKGICRSVKKLYEVEPLLKELDMYYVVRHRIGLLKGFLRDVSSDGYLQAKVAGLTNTLRFKHSEIVNLPKYTGKNDFKDGVHIRGVLVAPEGMILCGSDMSSLEDRTKQHYMYYFDPEYVEEMNTPGFDPHLNLAEFAYKMTNGDMGVSLEDIEWFKIQDSDNIPFEYKPKYQIIKDERGTFKTVNYGAVYGAGAPTMSNSSGMPVEKCTILLKAYWDKNWSVKEIEKACITKEINGQMWLFNPVSKFWYSLRFMKDRFSTLNQGTGVYVFDNYVKGARQSGLRMCGQFHDEIIFPLKIGQQPEVFKKLTNVINNINKEMKLNREMGVDIQFGNNYAQIH